MLLDQVYRHRRLGMILVFVFIGLPMVFFIPGAAQFTVGDETSADFPVAKVGSTPVTAGEFVRQFAQAQEERQRFGQNATAQDLVNDGTVDGILDSLINQALIAEQTKKMPVRPNEAFLQGRLRDDPYFKNDQGEFDPGLYNQWVQGLSQSRFNWDSWYQALSEQVNQEAYLDLIGASARVTEREVRKLFDDQNTKLKIRAIAIEPKVEITEDELRAYYDAHLDQFMAPEERAADYVKISMLPDVPPLADELIAKANAGEDFAELAKAHSDSLDADTGGDLGWISETPGLRDHEKVLFEMQPGEFRGPVRSFMGLHIYKVEETRTDEAGNRQVHARQILLRPQLDPSERDARLARIESVRVAATSGDLLAAAADADLDVHRTGRFSDRTDEIEGIPESDMFPFRREIATVGVNELSPVITGQENLYLATVVELFPPSQQTFEEARDEVEMAAVRDRKQAPEYQQRVAEYITRIRDGAKSIDDVKAQFPELPIEVKATEDFGVGDMLFNQGLFMDARQILGWLVVEDVGSFTGPYSDMLRVPHFIELTSKTLPEGETWDAQYETERDELRKTLEGQRELQQRVDYLQHLLARANDQALIQKDYDAVFRILGLDQPAATPTPAAAPAPIGMTPQPSGNEATSDTQVPVAVPEDSAPDTAPAEPATPE